MRTIKRLPVLVALLLSSAALNAQLLDPKAAAKDGATNRANDHIDQGVNKGLDKVEAGIGGLFKKRRKKTDSQDTKAPIISLTAEGLTLQDFYLSLEVESNWLAGHHVNWETGQPDMPGSQHGNKTHCSAFVAAACKKAGVYVLCPPEHGQLLLANAQFDWLASPAGVKAGWHAIEGDDRYSQAQSMANHGKIVIAICKNPEPKEPGHAALVMPKERSQQQLTDDGPELIMAGTHNHNFVALKNGFHSHIPDWPEEEIRFYVQEQPLSLPKH